MRKHQVVEDEREREECASENTLDEWMREGNTRRQFPRGGVWGGTLHPNYYVRMLIGMNAEKHPENLTEAHLERAKSVLRRFDLVVRMDDMSDMTKKMDTYFNTTLAYPSESNNHLKSWTTYATIVEQANECCKDDFERQNNLDLRLYDWICDQGW